MKELIEAIDFSKGRGEYLKAFVNALLSKVTGNIVEIGGGFGENTILFLEAAKAHGRNVLVIDPYESGWEEMPLGYQYPFEKFQTAVKGYDNLILHKFSSLNKSCPLKIAEFAPIAFVFIDGLQYKDAVLSDLRMIESFKPSVICVDDANRLTGESEVPLALKEFNSEYKVIKQGREAFLCLTV